MLLDNRKRRLKMFNSRKVKGAKGSVAVCSSAGARLVLDISRVCPALEYVWIAVLSKLPNSKRLRDDRFEFDVWSFVCDISDVCAVICHVLKVSAYFSDRSVACSEVCFEVWAQ
jgi:hypothetical protein